MKGTPRSEISPKSAPKFLVLSWQVEKSSSVPQGCPKSVLRVSGSVEEYFVDTPGTLLERSLGHSMEHSFGDPRLRGHFRDFESQIEKKKTFTQNFHSALLTYSFCHLYFVKEFLRFGRKISEKIG